MRKTKPLVFTHRLCVILTIVALLLSVVGVKATETFSGEGNDVTKVFELQEGVAIFDFEHGKGNFFVNLYNAETGSLSEYLYTDSIMPEIEKKKKVFKVNNRTGTLQSKLNPGKYLLEIKARGNWTITLEQPTEVSGESLPQTFRGRDDNKVFGPVKLKRGLVTVNCIHEGEGLFGVELYESNGEEKIHIIKTFEPYYKGTELVEVENNGNYYVHIFGNNDWTVKIMQVVTEPTPEITQAPTQSPSPSATPTLLPATSTSVPTTSPPVTATPTPEEGVPGFEALFTIVGLLAVTYLLRRRV